MIRAFLLLLLPLGSVFPQQQKLSYISTTQNNARNTTWQIEQQNGKWIAGSDSDDKISMLELTETFLLQKYEQKEKKDTGAFTVERDKTLLLTRQTDGKKIKQKKHDIGNRPWVQDFTFGFKDFLQTQAKEYKFFIVNPKDLDKHEMVAIKQDIENIKIQNTSYKAQKLKITLTGFKSKFWKAEAWYDLESQKLLKYKANEGPGTPVTETVLIP